MTETAIQSGDDGGGPGGDAPPGQFGLVFVGDGTLVSNIGPDVGCWPTASEAERWRTSEVPEWLRPALAVKDLRTCEVIPAGDPRLAPPPPALAAVAPTDPPAPVGPPAPSDGLPEDPRRGLYIHPATGSFYVVLGVADCSTNGPRCQVERSVIYWSVARKKLCYREVGEFTSPGRFVPVDGGR